MTRTVIPPAGIINFYRGVDILPGQQRVFKSKEEQSAYFAKRQAFKLSAYSYISRGVVRVEKSIADLKGVNFITYKNTGIDPTLYYAKILDINYISNATTEIIFKIDYFQTYMFDFEPKKCSIEREHLSEEEYTKAKENPYRDDIAKLRTEESFASSKEDEVFYTETPEGLKAKSGTVRTLGNGRYCIALYFNPPTYRDRADSEKAKKFKEIFKSELKGSPSSVLKTNGYFEATSYDGVTSPLWVAWELVKTEDGGKFENPKFINKILQHFTEFAITSSIVSMQYIPEEILKYSGIGSDITNESIMEYTKNNLTCLISANDVKNDAYDPKLSRFPYQYVRVVTPDGTTKELKYEKAWSLSQGGSSHMHLVSTLAGQPTQALIPYNYQEQLAEKITDFKGGNLTESIIYTSYPKVPFIIDSYLSHIATSNQQYLMNSTASKLAADRGKYAKQKYMDDETNILGLKFSRRKTERFLNGIKKAIGLNPMSQNATIATDVYNMDDKMAEQVEKAESAEMDEARGKWAQGQNITDSVYASSKEAFNANEYHEGDPDTLNLIFNNLNFKLYFVQLKSSILEQYDEVLKRYGYRADTFGLPLVCQMIKGTGSPHFEKIDGKQITFCKARDFEVEAPYPEAAKEIADLFNVGCAFIYG